MARSAGHGRAGERERERFRRLFLFSFSFLLPLLPGVCGWVPFSPPLALPPHPGPRAVNPCPSLLTLHRFLVFLVFF